MAIVFAFESSGRRRTDGGGDGVAVQENLRHRDVWFFSSNNREAIVKVVDGCSFNQRYWIFRGPDERRGDDAG